MKLEIFEGQEYNAFSKGDEMPKILILDNDSVLVQMLMDVLQEEGYEAEKESRHFMMMLERAADFGPDLILQEILMPYLGGFDIIKILRLHDRLKDVPIIVITAKARALEGLSVETLSEMRIYDCLYKPFELNDLLEAIRRVLAEQRPDLELPTQKASRAEAPLSQTQPAQSLTETESEPELATTEAVNNYQRDTILIIDPDPMSVGIMTDALEEIGYRVVAVWSGAEALDLVERENPKLILLELLLPDIDGLILCTNLRARTDVPIIIVSAVRDRRDLLLGLKLGADDFIPKPVDVDELKARIEAVLRRSSMVKSSI